MSQESIKIAGQLGALGFDAMEFLTTKDSFRRTLMMVVAREVAEYRQKMDHSMAVDIANMVGKLFRR